MILRLLAGMAAAWLLLAQQNPRDTGPTSLVIEYRCFPNHRAELREFVHDHSLPQFESWKSNSIIAGYRILFSRYLDTNTWDMLIILSFSSYDQVPKWRTVERANPAGLPPATLAWTTGVSTYPVDLMSWKATDSAPSLPVYLVVPYTITVPAANYLQYFTDYVRPQCDGWMQEGVLGRYELYLQRYPAARPWDSLLVLQYNDDASLGARESVMAKVRATLQSNPAWQTLANSKQNIRVEKAAVIADEIAIRH